MEAYRLDEKGKRKGRCGDEELIYMQMYGTVAACGQLRPRGRSWIRR